MKKIVAVLFSLLVLVAMFGSGGCSGADDVVGIQQGHGGVPTPSGTPHPRPTPNPCRQNPADCD